MNQLEKFNDTKEAEVNSKPIENSTSEEKIEESDGPRVGASEIMDNDNVNYIQVKLIDELKQTDRDNATEMARSDDQTIDAQKVMAS